MAQVTIIIEDTEDEAEVKVSGNFDPPIAREFLADATAAQLVGYLALDTIIRHSESATVIDAQED